ncbi:hypothetical protein P879_02834 [Paragonimus westermani]|uniref:RRM domain-containing protein n=1 Tax=Paragonimus westermani TaxID=34504 RepID=A0A8T0DEG0_9TREM|nr:hypothetical protein P879_02834 [Paragonimus westermani]
MFYSLHCFFAPLTITNINLVGGESGSRGFCFVDFATRDELAKALERNDTPLAGRPVNVRIADPNTNERGGGGFGRDRNLFGGQRRGDGRRGSYRPAALRDEYPEPGSGSDGGEWRRGLAVNRGSDSLFSSGFNRSSEPRVSSFKTEPIETKVSERPKLNLIVRSNPPSSHANDPPRNPKIFGNAQPVDTASKDKEIEERLHQSVAGVH